MSSDDDQDLAKEASARSEEEEEDSDGDAIAKYKALLAGVVQQESSKGEEEGGMEISWGPREKSKKDAEKMTPWEQYLDKKKKKKQSKREGRKARPETEEEKPF